MTKRLNSKHKVDRRLKVNLWGRPKSPFNTRAYGPGQHGQTKTSKPSDKSPDSVNNCVGSHSNPSILLLLLPLLLLLFSVEFAPLIL